MSVFSVTRGDRPTCVQRLRTSRERCGTLLCLGLDPIPEYLPEEFTGPPADRVAAYFSEILEIARSRDLAPAAFKPNIGFFHALDRPRQNDFAGSRALARVLDLLEREFPGMPVILDSKRGDIARSSTNYGREAFVTWGADAMTVSPYMGDDSVLAMAEEARAAAGLVYVLAATSNPGAARFQALPAGGGSLVTAVAEAIIEWHAATGCCGAVVGATHPQERDALLRLFAPAEVPLLIPGVGSQGGSAADVMDAIGRAGYPAALARVNVSSAITHPWKDSGAPSDWRRVAADALARYREELR